MSKLRLLSLLSVTLVALTACSDDDKKDDDDQNQGDSDNADTDSPTDDEDLTQPLTVAQICTLYATGVSSYSNNDQCGLVTDAAVVLDSDCAPGGQGARWAEHLLESATANRIAIDWAKARECTQQARALRAANSPIELARSSEWQALRTGACAFYTPLVDTNGACSYVWDCKNASDYCSTDAPYETASFTCKQRRAVGADCDLAFNPCVAGAKCDPGSLKCLADVLPCASGNDCASGSCLNGACIASDSIAIGGQCDNADNCAAACAVCSQHAAEATKTCKLRGNTNAACETYNDCASGLGCTDGVCKALPVGTDCDHSNDVCALGSLCLQPVDCAGLAQPDCTANAPYCGWNGANCVFADGRCTVAPTSGACLAAYSGQRCSSPAQCVMSDETCRIPAAVNEACDQTLATAPPCANNLKCVANVCVAECGPNTPCSAGQYCSFATDPRSCLPLATDVCTQDDACGAGKYCPLVEYVCLTYTGEAECVANADCAWDGSQCVPGASPQRHCVALRQVGEVTYGECSTLPGTGAIGQNSSCESSYCINNSGGLPTCVVTPRGCMNGYNDTTYDGTFIAIPFIFGLVRWNRRRKR